MTTAMFWVGIATYAELGFGISVIIFMYRLAYRRWEKKLAVRRAIKDGNHG